MTFKFPSIAMLARKTSKTFLRFPFVIVSAILGAVVSMALIEVNTNALSNAYLIKLFFVATLGLPLFLSLATFSEKKNHSYLIKTSIQIGGVALLIAYYFSLGDVSNRITLIRYFQLNLSLHLLVAFSPFINRGEINGFWQYNRILFLRFLTGIVFSAILFGGLSGAMAALDNLFGVNIDGEWYGRLWIFIVFVFNTAFFLSGAPKDIEKLEDETAYPLGLKVLTQFVLIPLVTIYYLILLAYTAKITVMQDWPKGWIGWLVSGASLFGMFSLLLVYPIQELKENRWIKTFTRFFYISIFPLLILLLCAVWIRVSDYGVTENRYFLAALALWLGGIAVYFNISKSNNIKAIPASLCIIALLTSFGPWGAYGISEMSQIDRLRKLLVQKEILVGGKIQIQTTDIGLDASKNISSILVYLVETHGIDGMSSLFDDELRTIALIKDDRKVRSEEIASQIADKMGVKYVNRWGAETSYAYFNYSSNERIYDIEGYQYDIRTSLYQNGKYSINIDGIEYVVKYIDESKTIELSVGNEPVINIDLDPLILAIREEIASNNNYAVPLELMTLVSENEKTKIKLFFTNISGNEYEDDYKITSMSFDLLIGVK